MKNKLKKIRNLLVIALLIALSSCETEKLTESVSDYNQEKQHFKRVHLDEIPFIKNSLKSKTQSIQGRSAATFLDLIKTDNIIVKEDLNGKKSYTFALNFEEFETLTNLVIKETDEGLQYDLVKYISSNIDLWKESVKNNENPTIDVSIDVESLEILNSNESRSCIQTAMVFMCPSDTHDVEHAGSCTAEGEWHMSIQYVFVPCGGTPYATTTVPYSGQLGNSTSSGGTSPNISQVDPCVKVKQILDQNPVFKQKLKQLATQPQSATVEKAIALYADGTDVEFDGIGGKVVMSTNPPQKYIATAHIHDAYGEGNGTYSVHSLGDLEWVGQVDVLNSKVNLDKFVSFLATADGTYYAFSINNKNKFRSFFNYLKWMDPNITPENRMQLLETLRLKQEILNKYYNEDQPHPTNPLIKVDNTNHEQDLKYLLQFIAEGDFGISVLETDVNFETFSEVKLSTDPSQNNLPLPRINCK